MSYSDISWKPVKVSFANAVAVFCLQTSGSQVCRSNHAQVNSCPSQFIPSQFIPGQNITCTYCSPIREYILNNTKSLIKLSMVDANEKYYKVKKNIFFKFRGNNSFLFYKEIFIFWSVLSVKMNDVSQSFFQLIWTKELSGLFLSPFVCLLTFHI